MARKNFVNQLKEDFQIREFFQKNFSDFGIDSIIIERLPGEVKLFIHTSRPGFLIGRRGEEIERIKERIEKEILGKKEKEVLRLEIVEIRGYWTKANLAAQWIAKHIEKRMPYRRVLKQALEQIMANKEVKGAKVEVSGRLDGSEIARREWLKQGQLPLQTLKADIDYARVHAFCSYGTIGVKVWVYKGEC